MYDVLEELKTATGWDRITPQDTAYVIDFDEGDKRLIRGLAQDTDTFILTNREFMAIPISFRVRSGSNIFQYWTLNKRLHRIGGGPAKIIYLSKTGSLTRYWYNSGMLNRDDGPAIDYMDGMVASQQHPETGEELDVHHVAQSWTRRKLTYFSNGVHASYPRPTEVVMDSYGYQIVRGYDHTFESRTYKTWKLDYRDGAALSVPHMKVSWEPHQNFAPYRATVWMLEEDHEDGEFKTRRIGNLDMEWKEYDKVHDDLEEFTEFVVDEMLDDINLWNGPFFKNAQDEIAAQTEFWSFVNEQSS